MTLMDTILRRKPVEAVITQAEHDLRQLIVSIWKAEYRNDAPDWQPLPDLVGMISQMDNMYAGVRGQRDQAIWDRDAETKRANELAAELANANDRLTHMAGIERYAASLKPDAMKYREKLRRDREAAAAKRKVKGGADV